MSFSEDFIEKVRDASDIVDVIGQDTQLKGSGAQLMGVCPFPDHNEKTPSFSVNSSKQVYHCFGCQKGGNIYHYLRDMKGMNFPEAVETLANKAGIEIPKDQQSKKESDEAKDKRRLRFRISHLAARFFHEELRKLPQDHPAKKYLDSRGFNQEIIDRFLIGYAPDGWENLKTFLSEQRVSLKVAAEIGLLKAKKSGDGYFDIFRHRLMFPIVSHKDDFVGFGGRVIKKEDQPKYYNSPDSEIFQKGSLFYGLNESAKYIRSEDHAVVVEGYTDYLALYQAGIKCAVATLGTAMTDRHARLLKRHTKNIFVLFDGDEAGQKAAVRSLQILLAEGVYPKGLILPEGQDPDDFLKAHGAKELRLELQKAPDLFELVFTKWMVGFKGSASEKVQMIDRLSPILLTVQDRRLMDLYVQSVAQRFSVDPNWVWKALKQARDGASGSRPRNPGPISSRDGRALKTSTEIPQKWVETKIMLDQASKAEIQLINVALLNERALKVVLDKEILGEMVDPGATQVLNIIAERYRQAPEKFDSLTAYLQTIVEPHGHVAQHLKKPLSELDPDGTKKLIGDCVRRLKGDRIRQKQREMSQQLQNQQGFSSQEQLEQIMNIHKDRHSLDKD